MIDSSDKTALLCNCVQIQTQLQNVNLRSYFARIKNLIFVWKIDFFLVEFARICFFFAIQLDLENRKEGIIDFHLVSFGCTTSTVENRNQN